MRTYYWKLLKTAFFRAVGLIDLLAGLASAILAVLGHYMPSVRPVIDAINWAILGWAAVGVIAVRLILAPYWMAREEEKQKERLKGEVGALSEKLTPRITIETRGVNVVPTAMFPAGTPGPSSKWIQLTIGSATDAALIDCEVRLVNVQRIIGGNETQTILHEPVHCVWSNIGSTKTDIPAFVDQPANVFSIYANDNSLRLEIKPHKVGFFNDIRIPGKYRMRFVVSARGASTEVATCIFNWSGSYSDVSLAKEK